MKDNQISKWSRTSKNIYERFAAELEDGIETGSRVTSGNQDVKYGIELMTNRLKKKNLSMSYDIIPRGLSFDKDRFREWKDSHYSNKLYYRTCQLKKTVFSEDKKIYSNEDCMDMYQTVTDIITGVHVDNDYYCCPNCGAGVMINKLVEGCPYCGTYFKMDELYPKVSNFYFLRDYSRTEDELKSEIKKYVIPPIVISAVCYTLFFLLFSEKPMHLVGALIAGSISGVLFGGFLGYLVWAFSKLGGLFKDAGKSIGLLTKIAGTAGKFNSFMKKYSDEISFEYFQAKVISMIRVIAFADNPTELPIYTGIDIEGLFDDIIDMDFRGAIAIKNIKEENEKIYITADAYMIDYYEKNKKVKRNEDCIRVVMERKADIPIDFNFSIKKIQCPSCAGSFDATKNKICPFCNTEYKIDEMDWVINSIKIVQH